MTRRPPGLADRHDEPMTDVAPGWYVALPSSGLGRRPTALVLFGRPLVAWRDRAGRPVVMARYCPHQGASLAVGHVVDGTVRCAFHHWRFDQGGTCVAIPNTDHIPATARVATYPAQERHGFVWVCHGDDRSSLADLPSTGGRARYFSCWTTMSPARVVEPAHGTASTVDTWPGCRRRTWSLDDRVVATELLAATPVRPGLTAVSGRLSTRGRAEFRRWRAGLRRDLLGPGVLMARGGERP